MPETNKISDCIAAYTEARRNLHDALEAAFPAGTRVQFILNANQQNPSTGVVEGPDVNRCRITVRLTTPKRSFLKWRSKQTPTLRDFHRVHVHPGFLTIIP